MLIILLALCGLWTLGMLVFGAWSAPRAHLLAYVPMFFYVVVSLFTYYIHLG